MKQQVDELKGKTAPEMLTSLIKNVLADELTAKGLDRAQIEAAMRDADNRIKDALAALTGQVVTIDGTTRQLGDQYKALEAKV